MKKSILITIALVALSVVAWAYYAVWVFNGESYTIEAAAAADTSALINLKGYETIELIASVTGSDSVKIKTYVDGYFNGKYALSLYHDSLIVDNGTGNYTEGYQLRGYGTNVLDGYEKIRIRAYVSSGQVDDSVSALSYSMQIIGR